MSGSGGDHIDGLVIMARAHRGPEKPPTLAYVLKWAALAAALAVATGTLICLLTDAVNEGQRRAEIAREFKG